MSSTQTLATRSKTLADELGDEWTALPTDTQPGARHGARGLEVTLHRENAPDADPASEAP